MISSHAVSKSTFRLSMVAAVVAAAYTAYEGWEANVHAYNDPARPGLLFSARTKAHQLMKFMLLSRQVRGGTILQPKAARDCESQGGIACESIRYGCSKRRRSDRASFIG